MWLLLIMMLFFFSLWFVDAAAAADDDDDGDQADAQGQVMLGGLELYWHNRGSEGW